MYQQYVNIFLREDSLIKGSRPELRHGKKKDESQQLLVLVEQANLVIASIAILFFGIH